MLLTVREYARLKDVDERTARRQCELGQIPAVKMGGGFWLINGDSISKSGREVLRAKGRTA